MYKIGLTGGIASGKSTVLEFFKEKDVPYIDADLVARKVVTPGEPALEAIVHAFGREALQRNGTLDRTYLGRLVFGDKEKLALLNHILQKPIRDRIYFEEASIAAQGYKAIIFDIPLLIETGWHDYVDEVWLVYSNLEIRIERLGLRNHYNRQEALARIESQMSLEEKRKFAQVIIENNGSKNELFTKLEALWHEKKSLFGKVYYSET